MQEVRDQPIGPYFGYQCDEVTDASNWEQLGVVIRYVVNGKPIERLIEFIECEEITGMAICESIISCMNAVGLDPNYCRSQTMDGAGNMSGKHSGCAARFKDQYPKAVYHYCSCHDLNLAISKSCSLKEVQICLDTLKKLGIFFKYSPKRTRRLEKAVDEVNDERTENKIDKKKFKVFSETRWVEKHITLQTFQEMYQPILLCLEAISLRERNWDAKAVVEANGLLAKLSDSQFIASFQTIRNFFGYMSGLSKKLQGSSLDVLDGYRMVAHVREVISGLRSDDNEYDSVFHCMEEMAQLTDGVMTVPRQCSRQSQRSNVPASSAKEYFKRNTYLPYLDSLIQQLDFRFSTLAQQSAQALCLVPSNLSRLNHEVLHAIETSFGSDMPDQSSFLQELNLWKQMWSHQTDQPDTLSKTLLDDRTCRTMFPNITKVIHLLLLTSVTSSSVERANSSLRFIKSYLRSTMGGERFNALMLLFIHKDIKVDVSKIIDIFVSRNSRRMLLENPTGD